MSGAELDLKRVGGMLLHVSRSEGRYYYVSLLIKRRNGRFRCFSNAMGVLPQDMSLTKVEGYADWTLYAATAQFMVSEAEAHKISAAFPGIAVKMIPEEPAAVQP